MPFISKVQLVVKIVYTAYQGSSKEIVRYLLNNGGMVLARRVVLDLFLGKFKHGETRGYSLFTICPTEQQQNSCSIWQCLFFFLFKNSLNKHVKMRKCQGLLSKKESLKPLGGSDDGG